MQEIIIENTLEQEEDMGCKYPSAMPMTTIDLQLRFMTTTQDFLQHRLSCQESSLSLHSMWRTSGHFLGTSAWKDVKGWVLGLDWDLCPLPIYFLLTLNYDEPERPLCLRFTSMMLTEPTSHFPSGESNPGYMWWCASTSSVPILFLNTPPKVTILKLKCGWRKPSGGR